MSRFMLVMLAAATLSITLNEAKAADIKVRGRNNKVVINNGVPAASFHANFNGADRVHFNNVHTFAIPQQVYSVQFAVPSAVYQSFNTVVDPCTGQTFSVRSSFGGY